MTVFRQTLVVHGMHLRVLDAPEKMYREVGDHHLIGLDGVGFDEATATLILSFGNAVLGPLKMVSEGNNSVACSVQCTHSVTPIHPPTPQTQIATDTCSFWYTLSRSHAHSLPRDVEH